MLRVGADVWIGRWLHGSEEPEVTRCPRRHQSHDREDLGGIRNKLLHLAIGGLAHPIPSEADLRHRSRSDEKQVVFKRVWIVEDHLDDLPGRRGELLLVVGHPRWSRRNLDGERLEWGSLRWTTILGNGQQRADCDDAHAVVEPSVAAGHQEKPRRRADEVFGAPRGRHVAVDADASIAQCKGGNAIEEEIDGWFVARAGAAIERGAPLRQVETGSVDSWTAVGPSGRTDQHNTQQHERKHGARMVHTAHMATSESTVRVRIHGAAGEVTGSCYEVTTDRARVLVDFGMFQGALAQEARNAVAPEIDFADVDAVLVTHAHVDHCGRLGMLPRLGFNGPVFATEPTAELLPRVLVSSASLQQLRIEEAKQGSQPVARVIEPPELATPHPGIVAPPPILFFHRDADKVRKALRALPFLEWEPVADGIEMRFLHASHVIGAASIELRVERPSGGEPIHLVFSGDIGPMASPLLAPHQWPDRAPDLLVMESTNGARRFPRSGQLQSLESILTEARERGQRVLIPVFALGRAQTVLFMIAQAAHDGVLGDMPIYLDSAMASRASELYARHPHLLEASVRRECLRGRNPLHFPQLHTLMSRRESEALDRVRSGCVILAGSGFCDAGPILRHLKLAIDQPDTRILFAGHQVEGALGDGLLRGATRVEIDGATLDVRAKIDRIEGVSGHADAEDLLEWVRRMPGTPGRIVLSHGSQQAREAFAQELASTISCPIDLPSLGDTIAVS